MADKTTLSLTQEDRLALYAARRLLGTELQKKLDVRIRFDVYYKDPAAADRVDAFDPEFYVPWEPGFGDGPTSARFVVVDYDADIETLHPPAKWSDKEDTFVSQSDVRLDRSQIGEPQFRQVHAWAVAQRALDFYESGFGLGRRIPWGFQGNRLIIVPHAGNGKNAFYDRESKSLQFYYFNDKSGKRVHTCLSADIVNHEFGHAILDGIRPYYLEAASHETAAFHEFLGDLTAILIAFRNNGLRARVAKTTEGDLSAASAISSIAIEFGKATRGQPYLRTALNEHKMSTIEDPRKPHLLSEVLTGAMFDIVLAVSKHYLENTAHLKRPRTPAQALWLTIQRMQSMAIQPLDLLPPVEVTFRDYALAVIRAEEIANPTDPDDYRGMMIDAFLKREIFTKPEADELRKKKHVYQRLQLDVMHDIETIASSRAEAYRFLDDNRRRLLIPANVDVVVADLYTAQKLTREARRLPKQIVLQYVWREEIKLEGEKFGAFKDKPTGVLCGGTLVFDESGTLLWWARKQGPTAAGDSNEAVEAARVGKARFDAYSEALAERIAGGQIGDVAGGEKGLIPNRIPPFIAREVDGTVKFELAPHFNIDDDHEHEHIGRRQWSISS